MLISRAGYQTTLELIVDLKRQLSDVGKEAGAAFQDAGQGHHDNWAWENATQERSKVEGRILELEHQLEVVTYIDDLPMNAEAVCPGHVVQLRDEHGEEAEYTLLGSLEVDLDNDIISVESPLGKALLGHAPGDTVAYNCPAGILCVTILSLERSPLLQ
ncbi:MAG TPA: GreA/GreB family elongation factor [Patescibacteria group bacterium]